jgi:hypothetical protein
MQTLCKSSQIGNVGIRGRDFGDDFWGISRGDGDRLLRLSQRCTAHSSPDRPAIPTQITGLRLGRSIPLNPPWKGGL